MDDVVVWARGVVELWWRLKELLVRLMDRVANRLVLTKEVTDGLYRVEHNGRKAFWILKCD